MTKTLTEQWREGTLPDDTYYWKVCKENRIADKYEMYDYTKVCDANKIECIAPVPSYDEYKKLKEQLNEANEVIKRYSDGSIYLFPTWYNGSFEANKYLKKWGVK